MSRPPEGFLARVDPGAVAVLRRDRAEALLDAGLRRPERLTEDLPRGRVARLRLGSGEEVVVRAYRRGGVLGRLRSGYPSPGRFHRELQVVLEARRRGIPVPEPLGFVARRRGAGWRAWAVLVAVAGAHDLRDLLGEADTPAVAESLLARALAEIRRAHDLGLTHPDLNLGNVMLDDRDPPGAWILDLDRARLGAPRSARGRFREVSRLDRSVQKLFGDRLLTRRVRDRLMLDYAADRPELAPRFRRWLPGHRRRLWWHRALWRLTGRGSGAR